MKYIILLVSFNLVSCATDVKDWSLGDPNDGASMTADIANSRAYTSDSIGVEKRYLDRSISDQQAQELKIEREVSASVSRNY